MTRAASSGYHLGGKNEPQQADDGTNMLERTAANNPNAQYIPEKPSDEEMAEMQVRLAQARLAKGEPGVSLPDGITPEGYEIGAGDQKQFVPVGGEGMASPATSGQPVAHAGQAPAQQQTAAAPVSIFAPLPPRPVVR